MQIYWTKQKQNEKGGLFYRKQSFSISQQKGAESIAATNQTEKMARSREMDLAVFADWFSDGGSLGAALDF